MKNWGNGPEGTVRPRGLGYRKPALRRFGDVAELTRANTNGGSADGASMGPANMTKI